MKSPKTPSVTKLRRGSGAQSAAEAPRRRSRPRHGRRSRSLHRRRRRLGRRRGCPGHRQGLHSAWIGSRSHLNLPAEVGRGCRPHPHPHPHPRRHLRPHPHRRPRRRPRRYPAVRVRVPEAPAVLPVSLSLSPQAMVVARASRKAMRVISPPREGGSPSYTTLMRRSLSVRPLHDAHVVHILVGPVWAATPRPLPRPSTQGIARRAHHCLGHGPCGHDVDLRAQASDVPQLDAIADAGVTFEDVTAPSSWTWPSHASLFTGKAPWGTALMRRSRPRASGLPAGTGVCSRCAPICRPWRSSLQPPPTVASNRSRSQAGPDPRL